VRNQRGFTLLEILVATAIMGIAVAGVMNGLAASARTASRITEYDRAAMLARLKMDELLADDAAPVNQTLVGTYRPNETGGVQGGWQARIVPFESPVPEMLPGAPVVERVELEIWWMDGPTRRIFSLEGIRRGVIPVEVPK
jgi:general secretion pathway protein I